MNLADYQTPQEERFRGRLSNTFLRVLLPISLITIMAIGGVTYLLARNAIQSQVNAQLNASLDVLAVDFTNWLTTKNIRLDLTTRNEAFQQAIQDVLTTRLPADQDFEAAREIVLEKLSDTKTHRGELLFNHFLIVQENGYIIVSSNQDWEGQILPATDSFDSLTQQAGSQAVYDPSPFYEDEIVVLTSFPYLDEQGSRIGTIFGVSSSISVQGVLAKINRSNPFARAYLITASNEFITLDPYREILVRLEPSEQQKQVLLPLRETNVYGASERRSEIETVLSFDGAPTISAYTWLPSLGAGLVVELPQDIAFGQLNSLGPYVTILVVFLGALIAGVSIFATQRLVRPLRELTQVTEQFSQGNWDRRASVRRDDEIGRLAYTFNQMASDLSKLYRSLETQVLERTSSLEKRSRQLEATAQVARETAAIRNLEEMLTYTTELIAEHFNFYHAGIFLLDNVRKFAVLQASNSKGGQRMLRRGHKLEVGQTGVVGYVASTGLPRIALDVGADAFFFDNPDLPNTRSEIALPLKIQNRVIGVLDVQSTQASAFGSQDVEVLQVLADQISLAIENARLLEQSQDAIKELQMAQSSQMRLGWNRFLKDQPLTFHYDRVRVTPATEDQIQTAEALSGHQAEIRSTEEGSTLTVPITLRDQSMGAIILRRDPDEVAWSHDDLELVHDALSQVAVALDNARLLNETLRRAEFEQTVSDISSRISRSIDIDNILRTAVRELGQLPNVTDASIHIGPTQK